MSLDFRVRRLASSRRTVCPIFPRPAATTFPRLRSRGGKMSKKILGVVAGLLVWVAVVMVVGELMRRSWPAYASVADAMTFTLPMMVARLSIGAVATVVTGMVTAAIARSVLVGLMPGVLLLIVFIPIHATLWDKFPVWYHLTFLVSLVPVSYLGGTIGQIGLPLVPASY